jgi:signal peptidase II
MQASGRAPLTSVVKRRARIWAGVLALAVIALDHLTKFAVVRTLAEGESRPLIGDVLRLSHIRNSGAAFGVLKGLGGILVLAALVGVVTFALVVLRNPDRLTVIGAGFVAGGAAGNLVDRMFRPGGVVDFVDFRFWPAFNVADSAITVGAILLLLTGFRTPAPQATDDEPAPDRR